MTITQYKILYDMAERGCRIVCVDGVYYLFDKKEHRRIQEKTVVSLWDNSYIDDFKPFIDTFYITRKGRNAIAKYRALYELCCCEYHAHRFPECFIKIRKAR